MTNSVDAALKIAADLRKAERRVDRDPTDAQKESGTYRKGHLKAHGLDITIENPKGSERSGIGGDGKRWTVKMPAAYGYVKGTEGHDGDHVDVYLGPDHASQKVYVVDQIDADTGSFDEHKCLLSFKSKSDALDTYKRAFSDGKGADRIGSVTEMSVADFRDWLKSGNTKEPMRKGYADGGGVGRWAVPMIAPQPKPESFTDKTKRLIFSPQPYADGGSTMPLIKSGSREAIGKNIKAERAAGKPQDQAIAIALSVARRAKKRARGGEVDDLPSIPGVVVRDPTENVLEGDALDRAAAMGRRRRHVQAQAMAGREPDAFDVAALEAYKPELLQRQLGMLAEGAPSMLAGPASAAAGPILSAIKTNPVTSATIAGLGSIFAPSAMGQGDAVPKEAADDMARFVKGWQELNPRRTSNRVKAEEDARKAYLASDIGRRMNDPGFNYSAAAKARNEREWLDSYFKRNPIEPDESVEDYAKRGMQAWNERRALALQDTAAQRAEGAFKKTMEDRTFAETPFEETWWGRNVNPTVTPALVGGLTGLTLGAKDAISGRIAANRWEKALDAAESAKTPVASLAARARVNAAQAGAGRGYGYGLPMALGAFEGAASTALPIFWNRGLSDVNPERRAIEAALAELPPGHPDRYRYEPRLNDVNAPGYAPPVNPAKAKAMEEKTLTDAIPEAIGRGMFGAGAAATFRLPGTLMSPSKARLEELGARTSQSALTPKEVADEAARMFGVKQADQAYITASDQARTEALKIARGLAEARRNGTSGLQTARGASALENEADQLAASASPRSQGSAVAKSEADLGKVIPEKMTPAPVKREGRSQKREAAPSQSSSSLPGLPEGHRHAPYGVGSKVIGPDGKFAAHPEGWQPPKAITSEVAEQEVKRLPVPRAKTSATAEDNLTDPDRLTRGQKNGGVSRATGGSVEHALALANRYASGGNVRTGAIVGETGGRADKLPVSVPAGSFVVPADVVSALGEGNSLAGCKNLDKMFGGHDRAHMATGGQAVPIKISDGEYVIPPAAVSKIGNGDMDMGHRSLDKFVLAVRKQHINQLKKLPPPAR